MPLPAVKAILLGLLLCLAPLLQGCAREAALATEDDYFADDDYYDSLISGELPDDYQHGESVADPLEPWNRFWFSFNDAFLEYLAKPLAEGYEFVTPSPVRRGISNFFKNLRAPLRIINCFLQGEGQEAGVEFSSFILNSVWGLGGIFDLASQHESVVPATGRDFGQTLGRWGMGEGVYLVLPFLGPSNVRDATGALFTYGYNTLVWEYFYPETTWYFDLAVSGVQRINSLGEVVRSYESLKSIAVDPYTAMRDGYTKLRRSAVAR